VDFRASSVSSRLGTQKYDKIRRSGRLGSQKYDKIHMSGRLGAQKYDKLSRSGRLGAQKHGKIHRYGRLWAQKYDKLRRSGRLGAHKGQNYNKIRGRLGKLGIKVAISDNTLRIAAVRGSRLKLLSKRCRTCHRAPGSEFDLCGKSSSDSASLSCRDDARRGRDTLQPIYESKWNQVTTY
jgi:hypothetical protein